MNNMNSRNTGSRPSPGSFPSSPSSSPFARRKSAEPPANYNNHQLHNHQQQQHQMNNQQPNPFISLSPPKPPTNAFHQQNFGRANGALVAPPPPQPFLARVQQQQQQHQQSSLRPPITGSSGNNQINNVRPNNNNVNRNISQQPSNPQIVQLQQLQQKLFLHQQQLIQKHPNMTQQQVRQLLDQQYKQQQFLWAKLQQIKMAEFERVRRRILDLETMNRNVMLKNKSLDMVVKTQKEVISKLNDKLKEATKTMPSSSRNNSLEAMMTDVLATSAAIDNDDLESVIFPVGGDTGDEDAAMRLNEETAPFRIPDYEQDQDDLCSLYNFGNLSDSSVVDSKMQLNEGNDESGGGGAKEEKEEDKKKDYKNLININNIESFLMEDPFDCDVGEGEGDTETVNLFENDKTYRKICSRIKQMIADCEKAVSWKLTSAALPSYVSLPDMDLLDAAVSGETPGKVAVVGVSSEKYERFKSLLGQLSYMLSATTGTSAAPATTSTNPTTPTTPLNPTSTTSTPASPSANKGLGIVLSVQLRKAAAEKNQQVDHMSNMLTELQKLVGEMRVV